jgi:hypothetical protein
MLKIKSELYGDMQRVAEMSIPHSLKPETRTQKPEKGRWGKVTVESQSNKARGATNLSEIPCRVSSDLHEWRNDLGTVSTRGSANL